MKIFFNLGTLVTGINEKLLYKEVIKINYIIIPKEIILTDELGKDLGDKRVLIYSYLASKRGLDDTVGFTCNYLVKWCGYYVDYHENRINDQITKIINKLKDNKYLQLDNNVSADIFVVATLYAEKFDIPSSFALIYFDELEKIRNFKLNTKDANKMNASILLLVLSHIRVNMLRRQDKYIGKPSDKPEFCYRMFNEIKEDIGISSRYISRAIKILVELNIIATLTLPRYRDDVGNWHTEVTLFTDKYRYKKGKLDKDYNYQQELQWGVEYIKQKKFLSKKFDQNTEKGE